MSVDRHPIRFVAVRGVLLAFGLLFPLHLPSSLGTATDAEKTLGWWASPRAGGEGPEPVVIRTIWQATSSGLLPGDVILELNGEPVTMDRLFDLRAEARPGDTLHLVVRRGEAVHSLRVPVTDSSPSYAAYRWYRLALAIVGWVVGMGIVAWRGVTTETLLLSGALLLLGPVTVPVVFAEENPALRFGNAIWHLAGGVYRFLLPILLLLFLLRHSSRRELARSRVLGGVVVMATLIVAGLISDGFRRPLGWAPPGFGNQARAVTGLGAELAALAGVLWISRDLRAATGPVRWVAFAAGLALVSGGVLSAAMLAFPSAHGLQDGLRQVKALTLALLPVAAALYATLATPREPVEDWDAREHASAIISVFLTALYGFAVAGAAGVVLSVLGKSLDGAELPLFGAIFIATIVFSPVLRWARDMVDRHVFSRWAAIEQKAHAVVHELNGDLEPNRLVDRLRRSVPHALNLREVDLVVASEVADGWDTGAELKLRLEPRAALEARLAGPPAIDGTRLEAVRRPDGELMGVIEYRLPPGRHSLAPPERTALDAIAQGVAVALRNTESYFELQRANRELSENERFTALAIMAGALAHEIKNPLASLKMGLYLLRKENLDPARLRRIEGDVRRMDDLVSSLLRVTRDPDPDLWEPVDVCEGVRSVVADLASFARGREIEIEESYPPGPVTIMGGASEVRTMFSSILRNALDASPPGGRVAVRVTTDGDEVAVIFEDEGPGVPPGLRRRIFDLNFSTKPGGSGLGLALARREAERLGGRIELDATRERGTALRVTLPAAAPTAAGRIR